MRGCIVFTEVHTGLLKAVKDIFNISEQRFLGGAKVMANVSDLH